MQKQNALKKFELFWISSSLYDETPLKALESVYYKNLSQSSCLDVGWFFKILEFDSELAST